MIKFIKPSNLNGAELLQELNAEGVLVTTNPLVDGDGNLWLDITEKDQDKAKTIVEAHNGTIVPSEPTIDEKLASVGLSINDLKAALGL